MPRLFHIPPQPLWKRIQTETNFFLAFTAKSHTMAQIRVFSRVEAEERYSTGQGQLYTNNSFAQACKRGCRRAGVDEFVPYDLRRTVATKTRASLGKEAAKTLLGHAEESTTDIYLLEEVQEAMKVAKALAKYGKGK